MKRWMSVVVAMALVLLAGMAVATGTGYSAVPQVDLPTVLTTITVGTGSSSGGPQGVGVDVVTGRVFVSNSNNNTVYVVDSGGNSILGSVTTNVSSPAGVAVNPGTRKVYVANSGRRSVIVINADSMAYVTEITGLGPGPMGVAIDQGANRVYVTNFLEGETKGQSVSVINGTNDTLITTVLLTGEYAYGIGLDTARQRAYISSRWGQAPMYIEVLNTDLLESSQHLDHAMRQPAGIAVRPSTGWVFVANRYSPTNDNPSLAIFDANYVKLKPWGTGLPLEFGGQWYGNPVGVAYNPFTDRVFVNSFSQDAVVVVDAANLTIIAALPVGDQPDFGIAVNPVISRVYVANRASGTLTVIQDGAVEPTPTPTATSTPTNPPTPTPTSTPTVTPTPTPVPCNADAYEPDNTVAQARVIIPTEGYPQSHSFCGEAAPWYVDEDWVVFTASGSESTPLVLTMTTSALTGGADTVLTLYGPNQVLSTTKLASNDDVDPAHRDSQIVYPVTASGHYWLHVNNLSPNEMLAKAERLGLAPAAVVVPQRDYVLAVTGGLPLSNRNYLPVILKF